MAYSDAIKNKVRANFIKGMALTTAAAMIGVPHQTARTWKRKAKADGDNWDNARVALKVSKGGASELTAEIVEDFILTFKACVEELKKADGMSPIVKAQTLSQLSDAYQKSVKAMSDSNPKLSKLAIVMDVLKRQGDFIRAYYPDLFEPFSDMLGDFGKEIASVYS